MSLSSLKLHNAMWPGLVGKGDGEGDISLNDSVSETSAGDNKERQGTVVDVEVFADEAGRNIDEPRLCRDVQMAVALYELTSQKIDEELEDVQNAIDG